MIARRLALPLLLALGLSPGFAARPALHPGEVPVVLETGAGPITVVVDTRHAPITANNFLRYVDSHKFDGTYFYRAARSKTRPGVGLIQGGIDQNIRNSFFPIQHEPTNVTGIKHGDGVLSMARNKPGSAMGDFFICIGPASSLDAGPNYPGYAAFGHVIGGMDVVRHILTLKTYPGGFSLDTMGQTIVDRVRINSAHRTR
jgi:peptidyl-prolyl cis-trans isomerase A (cyclophilin A)